MGPFYKLVFSNNIRFRIARHVLFWFIWISFYAFVKAYQLVELNELAFSRSFPRSWLEVLIEIPVHIGFFYVVLYFLLPGFFFKSRYLSFFLLWIFFLFVSAILQHIYYFQAIPAIRIAYNLPAPRAGGSIFPGTLFIAGTLNAAGVFAAAIRLGKLFFIREKETELLLKEINTINPKDRGNKDAALQPGFLYNVLQRLFTLAIKKDSTPSDTIKKINDLILYSGYHTKKTILPLCRELDALEKYIELEKRSFDHAIDLLYNLRGDPANKTIIPYLLIPLAEHSFSTLAQSGDEIPSIDIQVGIENNNLSFLITSTKTADTSTLLDRKNVNVLNIERRLQLRYPGAYQLKKVIEPERLTLSLKLDLSARL